MPIAAPYGVIVEYSFGVSATSIGAPSSGESLSGRRGFLRRIPFDPMSDSMHLELAAFMVLVVVCTRSRLASQEWCRACRTVNEHRGRSTADANPVGDWFMR
jgi:hypothetical protein